MRGQADDRLERALGGWSERTALEPAARERARVAILLTPQVDALWWDQFNARMDHLGAQGWAPAAAGRWTDPEQTPVMGWGAGA